jgi:formylglycine-generating enzyme required for sulfatase activity
MSLQLQSDLLAQIRDLIHQYFDLSEFRDLCYRLGISYYDLPGENLPDRMWELVLRVSREGRLTDLLSFCAHLRPHIDWPDLAQPVALDTTPPTYAAPERNPRQIFLSHARQDAEFAHRLAADLRHHGWEIWIAPDSIRPGESWVNAINRGLAESGIFLLVLSPGAVNSQWVHSETNAAIGLQHQGEIRLIPLDVKAVAAPPLWRSYQWVSFQSNYKKGLELLLRELQPELVAEVDGLYRQLQTALANKEWVKAQTTTAQINVLYPNFRDTVELLEQAKQEAAHEQAHQAKVAGLYGRLQTAVDAAAWSTALDLARQIESLVPNYRDVPQLARRARRGRRQSRGEAISKRLRRIPGWGWAVGVVSGLVFLLLIFQLSDSNPINVPPSDARLDSQWTRPKDGMIMVYVPLPDTPFELLSGTPKPRHNYWIDKYEVSNVQYQLCVDAGACEPAPFMEDNRFNREDFPVIGVSWLDAVAYSTWLNESLPEEAVWEYGLPTAGEWEYAAVGTSGAGFPWGDKAPSCELANYGDCVGGPAAVDSYPAGASWVGAVNMGGNVWEWTDSGYDETETSRTLRGGSWLDDPSAHVRVDEDNIQALEANRSGFRLVARLSLPEPTPTATPTPEPTLALTLTHTPTPTATPSATPSPTATPDPDMLPPSGQLRDEWERPQDGMVMVYVPPPEEPFVLESGVDAPAQEYWIDKYTVTNTQYQLCVDAGVCEPAEFIDDSRFNGDNHPVVGVSWFDASAYSRWVGGVLPTESEWEYAAVGENATIYPWGNDFDGARLNFCDVNCPFPLRRAVAWDDDYVYTSPVNAYPAGASWVGALDMAGNIWEWTASWSDASLTQRVVKGGAWGTAASSTRAANFSTSEPFNRNNSFGFRVVIRNPFP